jgi:hypothetical protein
MLFIHQTLIWKLTRTDGTRATADRWGGGWWSARDGSSAGLQRRGAPVWHTSAVTGYHHGAADDLSVCEATLCRSFTRYQAHFLEVNLDYATRQDVYKLRIFYSNYALIRRAALLINVTLPRAVQEPGNNKGCGRWRKQGFNTRGLAYLLEYIIFAVQKVWFKNWYCNSNGGAHSTNRHTGTRH